MSQTPKITLKDQIFVKGIGVVDVNKTRDGFAHDGDGNTYQSDGKVWKKICCPDEGEISLSQRGGLSKSSRHSVRVR
jgi:hypothetical protein